MAEPKRCPDYELAYGFVECDTCRTKPGSPTLCSGCLANRDRAIEVEANARQLQYVLAHSPSAVRRATTNATLAHLAGKLVGEMDPGSGENLDGTGDDQIAAAGDTLEFMAQYWRDRT